MSKKSLLIIIGIIVIAGLSTLVYVNSKDNEDKDEEKKTESTMEDESTQLSEDTNSNQEEEMSYQYMDISPSDANKLIMETPNITIIDVSPVYANGHLPGAVNYYVGDGSLDAAIPTLDPDETYLVYCHNDAASISGAKKLIDAGFKNVYRLEGNYSAWVDAGLPVEK